MFLERIQGIDVEESVLSPRDLRSILGTTLVRIPLRVCRDVVVVVTDASIARPRPQEERRRDLQVLDEVEVPLQVVLHAFQQYFPWQRDSISMDTVISFHANGICFHQIWHRYCVRVGLLLLTGWDNNQLVETRQIRRHYGVCFHAVRCN